MSTERTDMDWEQVRLNGGPPCYARLGDKMPDGVTPRYCGRARRWEGHQFEKGRYSDHRFVPEPASEK